jgi:3-deoxy-D-manno-octulosonate 8-phosphate phosphatase (KDO 8-P phosphatase)
MGMADNMAGQPRANLADIQMLVLDVDGVLTDGTLTIDGDGSESKSFSVLDGHGIRLWRRAGLKVTFLSGRAAEATRMRAKQLDVEYVLEDCHYKLDALEKFLGDVNLSPAQVAYVGDDLPDLPAIRHVGFGVAVANAVDEVKQHADFVTTRPGGGGAVREVIEYILKSTGRWRELMTRYLPE